MKEVPVHEVPTHIETEDAMFGIPIRRWAYLALGSLGAYLVFMPIYLQHQTGIAFLCGMLILAPFVVLFFIRDEEEKPEMRFFYWLRSHYTPHYYLWRFSAARWERLHEEILGQPLETNADLVSGWLDEDLEGIN